MMLHPTLSQIVAPDIYVINDTQIFWGFDSNTGFYFVADTAKQTVISGDFENFEEAESSALAYWERG
jgi:hypothetical protein